MRDTVYFTLPDYEVFDAVPNNVLYGIDGDLYFIDTQIRLRS